MIVDGVAPVGDLELCYQARGQRSDPALLLIMGFGVQLDAWDEHFCDAFVERGFFLLRYDHRDVGHSSKLEGGARYTLHDLAADAVGVLDHVGVVAAHVAGVSMGGMVAQAMAIRHPERLLSLASIMSTTGDRGLPGPTDAAATAAVQAMKAVTRNDVIETTVASNRAFAGGGFPFDEDDARRRASVAFDRCHFPEGKRRLARAIAAADDRTADLASVRVPTVVIHGADDPLVPVACGRATAAAIPGAELVVIDGMGHELPVGAQPRILEAVVKNAQRAG